MPLSLRHAEVLHAVLEMGTMSGAARRLRISQPAVSRCVASAETLLGVRLFERSGSALTPTAELLELRGHLAMIFDQLKVARDVGDQLRYGAGRRVTLATTPAFAFGIAPQAVAAFAQAYPAAELTARMRDAGAIKAGVLTREIDLGVVYNATWVGPMASTPLCEVDMVALMPADHRLAAAEAVEPRDLADEPLIGFGRASSIGVALDRIFEAAGAGRRRLVVATGNSFMSASFVARRVGIALTDPFVLGTAFGDSLVGRPLRPRFALTPRIVWAEGRSLSAPEERLVGFLRDAGASWTPEDD